jgi:hypothetical protein
MHLTVLKSSFCPHQNRTAAPAGGRRGPLVHVLDAQRDRVRLDHVADADRDQRWVMALKVHVQKLAKSGP